jgi:hypothetical protein
MHAASEFGAKYIFRKHLVASFGKIINKIKALRTSHRSIVFGHLIQQEKVSGSVTDAFAPYLRSVK